MGGEFLSKLICFNALEKVQKQRHVMYFCISLESARAGLCLIKVVYLTSWQKLLLTFWYERDISSMFSTKVMQLKQWSVTIHKLPLKSQDYLEGNMVVTKNVLRFSKLVFRLRTVMTLLKKREILFSNEQRAHTGVLHLWNVFL